MDKEDVLLLETKDRRFAFAVYDELRRRAWSYFTIEVKVAGQTCRVYAVPTYAPSELQPVPLQSFTRDMDTVRAMAEGMNLGWHARDL